MNSLFKRSMAMLLVIIMVIAIVPLTASADATASSKATISVAVNEDGSYSVSVTGSPVTLTGTETSGSTKITKAMILNADPEGYVCYVTEKDLANEPGASTPVPVSVYVNDEGKTYVGQTSITVNNDLEWADYTIVATITNKSDSSDTQTSTYSSSTNTWSGSITLKKDASYKYDASLTPASGSASTMIDGASSGDFTAAGVSFNVKFVGNPTNAVIRNATTATLKGSVVEPSVKVGDTTVKDGDTVHVSCSGTFSPQESVSITMDSDSGYTSWEITSQGAGEATKSGNTLYYNAQIGGNNTQTAKIKFTGADVDDITVSVSFVYTITYPSLVTGGATLYVSGLSTSANGSTQSKALQVGKKASFMVKTLVNGYASMSSTQWDALSFSVSDVSDEYGEFTLSSGSKVKTSSDITSGTTIYYEAKKASGSKYDEIDIKVTAGSKTLTPNHSTTKIYTGGNAGYDFDDYSSKTDVVKYVAKTSTDSYNKATAFTIADFGKYLENYKESEYEDYYIMIDDEDDILLGTLYFDKDEADDGDKIYLDDIDDGKFRYCHTEEGVDQFEFTVYKASTKKAVSGSSGKKMWLIDDKSLLTGAYPILRDITVATYEDEEYDDFKEAFADAFIDDDSMTYVKITSLPSQGTLYNGTKKVSSGDTIKYSSLSSLSYEPDKNAKDTDDDPDYFTWNATNGDNYAINDAKVYVHYFEDEDDYEEALIAGDFTVYYTDTEVNIKTEYFDCAFFADDDDLETVVITSLPSKGYLYDGSTKITKKDYKIDYDDLDDLVYKCSKSSAADDDFEYIVIGDYLDDEDDCVYEGTVDIKVYDEEETKVDGKWSGQTTTSPTYTVSGLKSSSGIISYTADSKVVDNFLSTCKTGSELTIVLSGDSSTTGRSLTIDNSFFTTANVAKIPYITLSEGTSGAKLKIDTNTVKTYIGSGNSNFTITLKSSSVSTSAREVSLKIGTTNMTFPGVADAVLSIPYSKPTSTLADTVVMASTSGSSSSALVSSEYASSTVKADIPGSGTYAVATSSKTFSDTAENWAWTRGYIPSLTARGVINGYSDGTYLPNKSVTRAEFIKLLVTSLGLEDASAVCPFADVKQDANWASAYVGAAVQAGIVENSGNFNPNTPITRADMALYSYRAAQAANLTLPTTGSATTFTDQSDISSTHLSAIQAMQRAGIINGELDGSFNPNGDTVRAAAAKIIWFLSAYYYGWSTSGRS